MQVCCRIGEKSKPMGEEDALRLSPDATRAPYIAASFVRPLTSNPLSEKDVAVICQRLVGLFSTFCKEAALELSPDATRSHSSADYRLR